MRRRDGAPPYAASELAQTRAKSAHRAVKAHAASHVKQNPELPPPFSTRDLALGAGLAGATMPISTRGASRRSGGNAAS